MSPRLTRNVPGISGGASHSPDGSRTASPGTSIRARIVMNELSVCGPWPNCSSSAKSWGGECRNRRLMWASPANDGAEWPAGIPRAPPSGGGGGRERGGEAGAGVAPGSLLVVFARQALEDVHAGERRPPPRGAAPGGGRAQKRTAPAADSADHQHFGSSRSFASML